MDTIKIPRRATSDGGVLLMAVALPSTSTTEGSEVVVVPESQRYYWSPTWQQYEAEADHEIEAGGLPVFDSIEDLARDLLSIDE